MGTIAQLDVNLGMNVGGFVTSAGKAKGVMTDLGGIADRVYQETRTAAEQHAIKLNALSGLYKRNQIDADTYARAVRRLNEQLRDAQNTGNGGVIAGAFKSLAGGVTAGFLAAQAVRELGRAMVDAGKRSLTLAADFERAEKSFTTMYRSADRAKELMAQLKQFSAQTPFEFPEIKDAAVKLAGYGTEQRQIVPTSRLLGDLAAGAGQNINELAETYGKARIQGRAFSRDIYEFSSRGIPIQEALAKQFGVTQSEIMGLVETGQVGFGEIQRALASLTEEGGKFHGGLEAQSKTLHGLASTIHDNLNLALAEFGERLAVDLQLKKNAEGTVEWTNSLKTDLAPALSQITADLASLSKSAFEATNFIGGLFSFDSFSNGGGGLSSFYEAVTRLNLQFAQLTGNTERQKQLLDELGQIAARVDKKRFGGGPRPDEEKLRFEDKLPDTSMIDSIAALTEALEDQRKTLGMNANELKIYELRKQGALQADLESLAATAEEIELLREKRDELKATAKTVEDLKKKEDDLIKSMQHSIDVFNMTAEEAKVFDLEQATGKANEQARWLAGVLKGLREYREETEKAQRKAEEFAEKGRRVFEETRTPLEKYEARLRELDELKEKKAIDQDTYNRASKAANQDLLAAQKSDHERVDAHPAALLKGSAAAYSASLRGSRGES
ncbi:MAG TPA: tape measure protein, partial [Pirellulales bacterium]|nr:tape measure protein [Pirellulales bacterium]